MQVLGVIVICGMLNQPCMPIASGILFDSKEDCEDSLVQGRKSVLVNAPPEVYVDSATCFVIPEDA